MELKVDIPTLAGQDIDPATFQRVWNRVMPGQVSPREGTDTSIPDTALPAEPTVPPEETPPVEEQPPATPELPPVPDCPAQPSTPDNPEQPPVPDCPVCPECPSCPECPPCPDTPGTAPAPETPALCLGEASQGEGQRLEELMALACAGAAAGRAMARRASGLCARALSALARDHRSAFKRLSAAYFLITGKRYVPQRAPQKLPASLPLALRQQFLWEQQWEQKNKAGAQSAADPCLKELYLELAQEGTFHAGTIRSLLEQMS